MFPGGFDIQPALGNGSLHLRPLQGGDHPALASAASDPAIWAGHPANDRHLPEKFALYFQLLLHSATTLLAEDASGNVIGCSRYCPAPDVPDSISIGFTFLIRAHWGGRMHFAMKSLMLGHAFATAPEVWFHIAPGNQRSQLATAKLGAIYSHDAVLDLAGQAADWKCFVLTKSAWQGRLDLGQGQIRLLPQVGISL